MRTVSLMTANQKSSKPLKEVEQGQHFLITRRGRPVTRLIPDPADPDWDTAYQRMITRLEQGASLGGLRVDRETLYARLST